MPSNLKHEAEIYLWLRERLLEQHESLKDDDVALADTLEGITHLHEAIEHMVDKIAEDDEAIAGLAMRRNSLDARKKRIEKRYDKRRDLLLEVLQKVGKKRIDHPEFTITRLNSRQHVVIMDEGKIPHNMWRTQPSLPDKKTIMDILKQGLEVPGAELSEPTENLVIRRG